MKASQLLAILSQLPPDKDPSIVTGEAWLPEQLEETQLSGDLLFLCFDNLPDEAQGDEIQGFVEHEVALIRQHLTQILHDDIDSETKVETLLAIFLKGHELSSSEVIELLTDCDKIKNENSE